MVLDLGPFDVRAQRSRAALGRGVFQLPEALVGMLAQDLSHELAAFEESDGVVDVVG